MHSVNGDVFNNRGTDEPVYELTESTYEDVTTSADYEITEI